MPVPLAKTLLLAHVVAAGVLVGSVTHLAVQAVQLLRGRARPRLLALYPGVALVAWAVAFALGAWLYPHYRIHVRRDVLDVSAVWASILFDVKENLAVFAGPLLFAAHYLRRVVVDEPEAPVRRWFAVVCLSACGIAWWNFLSGLLIGSVRAV